MRRLGSARRAPIFAAIWLGFAALPAFGQAPATDTTWDTTKPRGKTREIDFTTSEGTWTSVDVAPDGTWLVFDLLGHIYRMPIAGGTAEPLTQESGIAINNQPRISPDGKTIAFISDRKGQMNIWLMDSDGKNPRPVSLDPKTEYRSPAWAANGQFIVALKLGAAGPSLAMFHRTGGGPGIELVKGDAGKIVFRPTTSADGRFVYYDVYSPPPGVFGRSDALMGAVQVDQLELKNGSVLAITEGQTLQGNADHPASGGAYAAEPSPDGRFLAFLRKVPGGTLNYKAQRFGPRSALWIRDLTTGAERLLMDPVEMDLSEESFATNGSYPSYKWVSDGKSIVIHQGGKIRRVDVASGQVATIPFTARVHRTISEQAAVKTRLGDGPVDVRFLRWMSASPDGKTLVFQAVGRLWLIDLPTGTPRRLTPDSFEPFEFQPAWSPDGQSIAFTSWHDNDRGALWVTGARPGSTPRRVTPAAGEYANPAWTLDGRDVILVRGAGATARGQSLVRDPYFDIIRIPAGGGEETFLARVKHDPAGVSRQGEMPRPSAGTNGRIYFAEWKSLGAAENVAPPSTGIELVSVRADGSDRIVHARINKASGAVVSPDGSWVAYSQGQNVYLAPLPFAGAAGAVPLLDKTGGMLPTSALSAEGGLYPHWRTGDALEFSNANRFFVYHPSTTRADTLTVPFTAPRDLPSGSIAVTGARIITLDNKQVIPSGTVVVKGGRITCVGRCSTAGVDKVINASGKTIIPGFIDMHAHFHHEHMGMLPAHNFETSIYLAYGVTTTFDPSTFSPDPFVSAELVETGKMIGPRIFSSAEALTNGDDAATDDVTSLDQALKEVARRKSWGSVMLKQYLQPTRYQRQWVVEAARRLGIRTTAEGSADLMHKLSMVMDGHTGGEHLTVQAPIYSDFLTFMAKAGYFYSHTPLVSGYGAWNEEYFWQESPVWQNAKLQQWMPWRELIPHTRRFIMRPETDYSKDIVAQVITDLVALGGHSAVGSHGQQHGIGSHWDVWMLAKAAGPMTALEVASRHGAAFLGMEDDLGSITVGKLADLMVLNANPLDNIRNTANIQYVMKAGTLFDALSLDEIWPKAVRYGDHYWMVPEMYRIDEKRVDTWDKR